MGAQTQNPQKTQIPQIVGNGGRSNPSVPSVPSVLGGAPPKAASAGITRRDLFLWAGATALAGCTRSRTPRIEGEIVGSSHHVGHLLREARSRAPSKTLKIPVVIAGGGIAGLSAAWKLRKSGLEDFVVLEMESDAGGNARSGSNAITEFPWGAHYVPLPSREARAVRELFEDLGVIVGADARGEPIYEERYLCSAPQERLFLHGRWHEGLFPASGAAPGDLAQLRRFRERMAEYRGAFVIPLDRSAKFRELDALSMREWMDREKFDSPLLRWYVDYACRDDYGCTLNTTSAWAGIHYYAARGEDDEVLTWPAGNGWIVQKLARPLGERLRTNALVLQIEGSNVDVLDPRTSEITRFEAKRVICALPRFVARRVVAASLSADGFTYAPWVVANVTVDRVPEGRGAPPCWDNVFYGSPSLGYVVATHQLPRSRPGPSVLTWYRPLTGDPIAERTALLERPWEFWREEVLRDFQRAHPDIEERVRRIDVLRFGHAMIRPVPGFLWGGARGEAQASIGPVSFAHSDLSGISIFEEAQYHGVRAAEETLVALGRRFASSVN